jgi:hypothetical protein
MYSSTVSLTSPLDGGGWSTPRPGRFKPEKDTRYSLYTRLGGPQHRSGRMWENLASTGIRFPAIQSLAIRYTDWAAVAHPNFTVRKLLFAHLEFDTQPFFWTFIKFF